MTARATPFPPEWTVEQGLNAYLRENGFTTASYDERWTTGSAFGFEFQVPNTAKHRVGLMLHDLHHVLTGFGTDLVGEGELSAWELARRPRGLGAYTTAIVASGAALGFILAPARAWAASRQTGVNRSLFVKGMTEALYRALLARTIGGLRQELGLPPNGIALEPRRLHALAPSSTPSPR